MGRPVRSLKILARHEASLRGLCRRLARELVQTCAELQPPIVDTVLSVAARLEAAGQPLKISNPNRPEGK